MIERDVEILTRDGAMNSFITYPEEGGAVSGGDVPDGRAGQA